MKKKTILSISICLYAPFILAQTEAQDSLTIKNVMLKEVVVEAENQRTSSTVSTYIPGSRQKNAAADAISLLSQMAIPQLNVDPASKVVHTAAGQPVSVFIDYVAATAQDLSGMRTTDVKKVEYLHYPQDPRFRGAQHVINFIMQKYEWGGYVKVHADQWFGVNRSLASVYSKFAYKAMTFDIFADEVYLTNHHNYVSSYEVFHFKDLYGKGEQTVGRFSAPLSSRFKKNSNDITFRALYASDKLQISNMLSFNNTSTPCNDVTSLSFYVNDFLPNSFAKSVASNQEIGLKYDFEFYLILNQKSAIDVQAYYRYGHNNSKCDYSNDDLYIVNNAVENYHDAIVAPNLIWNLDQHNSLMIYLLGQYSTTSVDYYGNSPSRQKYNIWGGLAGVRYTYSREKWSVGTQIGWVYANTGISGNTIESNYPQGNIFATYSPGQHHQFQAFYAFGKTVPATYQKSPNMLQQDALMWYQGNPMLKDYWEHGATLSYTWLPNNKWQLTATARLYDMVDRVVSLYAPIGPYGSMLRQYENDGNYSCEFIGVNATAKFWGGRLIAGINPEMCFMKTTGEYAMTHNELVCQAQLTWYFGNFYLFGWYNTPSTSLDSRSGMKQRIPSRYQIQLGYGKGSWRASVTAYNFLRSDWETSRQTLSSRYYQFECKEYGTAQHMRFQFSVAYTFGYGKKVRQENEVSGVGTGSSAILK